MKIKLTLKTAADRQRDDRTAMQETVQRAMNMVATHRIKIRKPVCRDAMHSA
jgi:hypothetical protein